MNKQKLMPDKRVLLGTGIILLSMMVVGSIWDYSISKAVYNQDNPFGLFLQVLVNILPQWVLLQQEQCYYLLATKKNESSV